MDATFVDKIRVANEFSRIVRQYCHLNHLATIAGDVVGNHALLQDMANIWNSLDFQIISLQAAYICPHAAETLNTVKDNVHHKLAICASVNQWADWVYAMTEEYFSWDTPSTDDYIFHAQQFAIKWSYIGSILQREVSSYASNPHTMNNSNSSISKNCFGNQMIKSIRSPLQLPLIPCDCFATNT